MHHFFSLFFVLIFLSCSTHPVRIKGLQKQGLEKHDTENKIIQSDSASPKFFPITIDRKTVIEIAPDSTAIEKMKKEMGEDNFYTAAGDWMYYQAELAGLLDSLNIGFVHTDKRFVEIITPGSLRFRSDTASSPWNYFYYDGKNLSRKTIFELLDRDNYR